MEPWTSRSFAFDFPVARIGTLLSRLVGTEARIASAVRGLAPATLTAQRGGQWSIQEHVGHLGDLDALHLRRLDELARGEATLCAADMSNRATHEAGHNRQPFAAVLAGFAARRRTLVARLRGLDADGLARAGMHPRLRQPMRAVDVAFFAAEHDDHHVARIEELVATRDPTPPLPAVASPWLALPSDTPLPKLDRRRVVGSEAMISHVTLHAGCDVAVHSHANEQFSCVLSGRVRFHLADGERVLGPGDVLHLPPHAPHGAFALETAVVLDVFAPPSANTGVDAQRS